MEPNILLYRSARKGDLPKMMQAFALGASKAWQCDRVSEDEEVEKYAERDDLEVKCTTVREKPSLMTPLHQAVLSVRS